MTGNQIYCIAFCVVFAISAVVFSLLAYFSTVRYEFALAFIYGIFVLLTANASIEMYKYYKQYSKRNWYDD